MGIEKLILVITQLIDFWGKQKIKISPIILDEIRIIEQKLYRELPNDFKQFYSMVNGMEDFYPNEIDKDGFLIYPVEAIVSVTTQFKNCNIANKDNIFVFAEFMHKSWWYGFELRERNEYVIGIIIDDKSFKPIANSLIEFIELYMETSPKIYC